MIVAAQLTALVLFVGLTLRRTGGAVPPVSRGIRINAVGAMIVLAFPLLVLERRFAALRSRDRAGRKIAHPSASGC